MPSDTAHKHTPRSEELKHDLQGRLNRIIGQLNAIKGMVDDDRYCSDLLMQLVAADKALQSIERMVLQDHISSCVAEKLKEGDAAVVDELVDLVRRIC